MVKGSPARSMTSALAADTIFSTVARLRIRLRSTDCAWVMARSRQGETVIGLARLERDRKAGNTSRAKRAMRSRTTSVEGGVAAAAEGAAHIANSDVGEVLELLDNTCGAPGDPPIRPIDLVAVVGEIAAVPALFPVLVAPGDLAILVDRSNAGVGSERSDLWRVCDVSPCCIIGVVQPDVANSDQLSIPDLMAVGTCDVPPSVGEHSEL